MNLKLKMSFLLACIYSIQCLKGPRYNPFSSYTGTRSPYLAGGHPLGARAEETIFQTRTKQNKLQRGFNYLF